ncbi:MAG: PEP-CTERM sorting domain-containing protein, partial [Cyanobacteriota bacterium]|nr:PEP-CTERM sorting domain-containing protein [Cyanobacteriota bacterium]
QNLNPGDLLGAFQDVPTETGQTYRLSFYFSPRPNRPATDNEFQVSFGNVFNLDFEAGAGGSGTDWQRFSTLVTANSDLTRLQFAYTGNLNTSGSYIDDVRLELETVPEPATLLGLATVLGLGTLLKQPRSRRQKKS